MGFLRDCLSVNQGNPWEHWRAEYRDAVSFRLIADSISDLGLGYVLWTEPDACFMLQEMCGRYASFVPPSLRGVSAARCPDALEEGYESLISLHERCVQVPTKVLALSLPDDSGRMLLSSMNAGPVGDYIILSRWSSNLWELIPQCSHRRSRNWNLYMQQDWDGGEEPPLLWEDGDRCFDHRIDVVLENGDRQPLYHQV